MAPAMMRHFIDDRHALYVGWVLGVALRNGIDATPELDEAGNYTDRIVIPFGVENMTVTVVVPPPPDDWSLE